MKTSQSTLLALMLGAIATAFVPTVLAQDEAGADADAIEEIVVYGIRGSLANALDRKRSSDNLIEVIQSEDIGKLPDQNLAEVLENVTGIQITRTAGVGTGVQIRGTGANRTEINGVSTVGSGSGRSGINFEDVSAGIIAGVDVIKAPEARTIEGSVGGTINLRTVRPLQLSETLGHIRLQGEESSLTTDGVQPRISGAYGDNWDTDAGSFGFVISGSFTEQESVSFRPRVDRDGGLVENTSAVVIRLDRNDQPVTQPLTDRPAAQEFDFLGIQFLNQELENFEYETTNIATTFEWAPNDDLTLSFDAFINRQERRQDSSRVQGSGVSNVRDINVPDAYETINYGSLGGVQLGSIRAASRGKIEPDLTVDDDDPNLRFSSDTGARVTDSDMFRFGADWQINDRLSALFELSLSSSDTTRPNLSTTLNFINPNPLTPLDGTSNDNSVPFIYDFTGGKLTWGVNFDSRYAPTVAQLTDPANVVLDAVTAEANTNDNSEDAFRADFSHDLEGPFTSVDFGYRYNKTASTFDRVRSTFGTSKISESPRGTLFSDLLIRGPSNYGSADGRALAVRNFLVVSPDLAFSDREGTLAKLQAALATTAGSLSDPSSQTTAFFDIEEKTHALYAQANFEHSFERSDIRGNFGFRYLQTDIDSLGNSVVSGEVTRVVTSSDYDFILPRLNLVVEPRDDLLLRFSWGKDIRRPDFQSLSTSVEYPTGPNNPVIIGNPDLKPEEVTSFDLSVAWYFAPNAVASIGYFDKERSDLFVTQEEDAAVDGNGHRDITPPCEGGGIYNPVPDRNVLSDIPGNGLCVARETTLNDTAKTTQTGFELALQYDLSGYEEKLGWASGFGFVVNYTIQDFDGGEATNASATRGTDIFNAINGIYDGRNFVTVEAVQGLLDLSENAYNFTLFYEKYGLSARMRYTWREAFRTLDTAAGATLSSTLGFPVVTADRGQLNLSVQYEVYDNVTIGLEAVNLTESEVEQYCVNDGAQLCFQGLADRRLTFGASYRF